MRYTRNGVILVMAAAVFFCFTHLTQAAVNAPVAFKLKAVREINSAVPQEKNIFVVNVLPADGVTSVLTLQLFIDDRLDSRSQQGLPYYFKRNFRGLGAGTHSIKLEAVDPADCSKVFFSATTTVAVQ